MINQFENHYKILFDKQMSKQNFDFDIEVGAHDDAQFCYNSKNLREFQLNSTVKIKF